MQNIIENLVLIGFHQWGIFLPFVLVGLGIYLYKKKNSNLEKNVKRTDWPMDSEFNKRRFGIYAASQGYMYGYRPKPNDSRRK